MRQADKRHASNVQAKSKLKTLSKKVRAAAEAGDAEGAAARLREATAAIDGAAAKGAIHKRAAARRVARLAKAANSASSSAS